MNAFKSWSGAPSGVGVWCSSGSHSPDLVVIVRRLLTAWIDSGLIVAGPPISYYRRCIYLLAQAQGLVLQLVAAGPFIPPQAAAQFSFTLSENPLRSE
jgi:hypothetical protein